MKKYVFKTNDFHFELTRNNDTTTFQCFKMIERLRGHGTIYEYNRLKVSSCLYIELTGLQTAFPGTHIEKDHQISSLIENHERFNNRLEGLKLFFKSIGWKETSRVIPWL